MPELRLADDARNVSHQPISGDIPDPGRKMKALANFIEHDFSPR
jgi:hypothetical protein